MIEQEYIDCVDCYDDYEEDLDDEYCAFTEEEFLKYFSKDVEEYISDVVVKFFKNKEMHCGGPVPIKMLLNENYIKMIREQDISNSVVKAYGLIKNSQKINCEFNENYVSDDIQLVVSILDDCAKAHIPKCFAGGIMLIYLEYCKGIF
jgi:hypothetical protein